MTGVEPPSRWRSARRRALRPFGRLNAVDVAHVHAKLAGGAWAVILVLLTPTVVASSLGVILVLVMGGFVVLGTVISITGIVLAARDPESDHGLLRIDLRRSMYGLGVELVGISLMLSGVALYLVTQVILAASLPTGIDRVALTVFAYWQGAQLCARLVSVRYRRRKEAQLAQSLGGTS